MVNRKLRFRGIVVATVALTLLATVRWWWTGGMDRVNASSASGQEKATAFVAAYAKHVGAHDTAHQTLDANHDRSFGDFGFHYFAATDVLQGRVLIVRSHIKDWPEGAVSERQTIAGLNNPAIGGMYDRGGGYFVLDEEKQMYFLVKDYSLSTVDTASFIKDFDNLNSLAGLWLTVWMPHVSDQSHGKEPPPAQRIDRAHNPYGTH